METYFYFGENDVATTGEAAMFPLSSFLGATPSTDDSVNLHFKARNGSANDDIINVDFAASHTGLGDSTRQTKDTMQDLALLLQPKARTSFVNFFDGEDRTGVAHFIITEDAVTITTVA